jgi:hypothetical protein
VIVLSKFLKNKPLSSVMLMRLVFFLHGNDTIKQPKTTLNNGYLGSRNDEERSEMRYVM